MISRILDVVAYYAMNPRKGDLFPSEDIHSELTDVALEPVRAYVTNDLINAPGTKCSCFCCENTGYKITDPNARPGRGVE